MDKTENTGSLPLFPLKRKTEDLIPGLLPASTPPIIAMYPTAFAMAVQWCSFCGVGNARSATTFSTNNFRQIVTAAFYHFSRGGAEYRFRMKSYALTLLSFHAGVAAIYVLWQHIPQSVKKCAQLLEADRMIMTTGRAGGFLYTKTGAS